MSKGGWAVGSNSINRLARAIAADGSGHYRATSIVAERALFGPSEVNLRKTGAPVKRNPPPPMTKKGGFWVGLFWFLVNIVGFAAATAIIDALMRKAFGTSEPRIDEALIRALRNPQVRQELAQAFMAVPQYMDQIPSAEDQAGGIPGIDQAFWGLGTEVPGADADQAQIPESPVFGQGMTFGGTGTELDENIGHMEFAP